MWTSIIIPDMPYLSERGLQGLKQYVYHSGGYTWLDDVHQPFWNCGCPAHMLSCMLRMRCTVCGCAMSFAAA
jgi:hypothetical protein